MKYNDINGNEIILSDRLGGGGEADVYTIFGCDNLLAKIYNDKHLIDSQKLKKLKKMCAMYDDEIAKYYAWPQKIIYSGNKAVGFIMENINYNNRNGSEYIKFIKFYTWKDRRRFFPEADYKFLIDAAVNLTISIEFLHKKGIVVEDINESNIFVNNTDATIKLIDCDSYQIDNYLCDVGIPAYTAPELPNKLRGEKRTKNHDYFSLAIVIFLILAGKHPYTGINTTLDKIRQSILDGMYCYGKNAKNKNISALYPSSEIYNFFSREIKNLFEQAFTTTVRPDTQDWRMALEQYKSKLKRCKKDSHHFYYPEYKSCIWCDIEKYGYFVFIPAPVQQHKKNNIFVILISVIIILAAIFCFIFNFNKDNQPKQFSSPTQSVSDNFKKNNSVKNNQKNNSQIHKNQSDKIIPNKHREIKKQAEPKQPQKQNKVQAPIKQQTKTQKTKTNPTTEKIHTKKTEYIIQKPEKKKPVSENSAPKPEIKQEAPIPVFQEKQKKYKYDMKKSVDDFYKGVN